MARPVPIDRRSLLQLAAASAGTLWLARSAWSQPRLSANPFALGVASGSPTHDSVVLWTRLLADGWFDSLGAQPVTVRWEIAHDEQFRRIAQSGQAQAVAGLGHSVHVEVAGLEPDRWYFYRFMTSDWVSTTGRTRTFPAPEAMVQKLRLAYASCQRWEHGYYGAYRHMREENLDAVLFLGDYIYEASWGRNLVRRHNGGRATTLDEYRERHAQYKSDLDLQAAHAAHPWILTWDDHEVTDDYTADIGPQDPESARFLAQRAAAYQAYWEHMPLSNAQRPDGPSLRLYDSYRFGDLAELFALDDRQYRSYHACRATLTRGKPLENCDERLDPGRTMLGAEQEAWFASGVARASARWNLLAQQTLMAELDRGPGERHIYWADGWDGYPAARRRLLESVAASPVKDTLVLGGDVHSFWATDLKTDFARAEAPVVATEFVGGSITSQGPPNDRLQRFMTKNPQIRSAFSEVNGYGLVSLDAKKATVAFRTLADVRDAKSAIATAGRFAVEIGRPGAMRA
jgi:alkaline phosphatase D